MQALSLLSDFKWFGVGEKCDGDCRISIVGHDNSFCIYFQARYIVDEAKDKTGEDLDVSNWEKEFVEELPAQENGYVRIDF